MQIGSVQECNHIYEVIADMGITISPSKAIAMAREACPVYRPIPLNNYDVNRVSWYGKHFQITEKEITGCEIWIGEEYINPERIEWVPHMTNPNVVYGIFKNEVRKEDTQIQFAYNQNVWFRVSKYDPDDTTTKLYEHRLNVNEIPEDIDIENCCYYITGNKFYKPKYRYENDTVIIMCPYIGDLDLLCATNLAFCDKVPANKGFVVDDVLETKVYTNIVIDHSNNYPITATFYPWIMVNKECFVRVYKDTYMHVKYPETCRLINYEEFADVEDPYNTDNDYLNNFVPSDIIIDPSDTEEELYENFEAMIGEWYRCFDNYPYFTHDSVFHIYANSDEETWFEKTELIYPDKTRKEFVFSKFPFDANRDILFYQGKVYSEYSNIILHRRADDRYELYPDNAKIPVFEYPRYILTPDMNPDDLAVVKLTSTGENTAWKNIEYYLDKDNLLLLYKKLNKFYRNVAVLEDTIYTIGDLGDKVWIGKEIPDIMDENLWIELLTISDDDVIKALANRIPDSITGLLPESLMEKMAKPLDTDELRTVLKNLHLDPNATIDKMEHHDVWIEWLDTVRDFIHYSSENTMTIRVNDHIYCVELDLDAEETQNEISIFAFDDIVLNYKENQFGTRYLTLLADLYKSKVIDETNLTIFYKRLITLGDEVTLSLNRVKDYTSSVVTEMIRPDKDDLVILYSDNLGRIQYDVNMMDEEDWDLIFNYHIIPYKVHDEFAYIPGRTMIFINGKLIQPKDIKEEKDYYLTIFNFHDSISTIDIFYNLIDLSLMRFRRISMDHQPDNPYTEIKYDTGERMEPIEEYKRTYAGYYDVIYRDYTKDNMRKLLEYYAVHKDEFEDFKKDFLQDFYQLSSKHNITDIKGDERIVLWGSLGETKYYLKPELK